MFIWVCIGLPPRGGAGVVARGVARGPAPHNATTDHAGLNVGVGHKTNFYLGCGHDTAAFVVTTRGSFGVTLGKFPRS